MKHTIYFNLVFALLFALSCRPKAESQELLFDEFQRQIDKIEAASQSGDFSEAHALVDYQGRIQELLPGVWEAGSQEAKGQFLELAKSMFEKTSRKYGEKVKPGKMTREWVPQKKEGERWLSSHLEGDDSFQWLYRFVKQGDEWRLVQREFSIEEVRNDSSKFWSMAKAELAKKLGHEPSLEELAREVPLLKNSFRARGLRVPTNARQKRSERLKKEAP